MSNASNFNPASKKRNCMLLSGKKIFFEPPGSVPACAIDKEELINVKNEGARKCFFAMGDRRITN